VASDQYDQYHFLKIYRTLLIAYDSVLLSRYLHYFAVLDDRTTVVPS